MSTLKVNGIQAVSGTANAISLTASDKTCTANITNIQGRKNRIINGNFSVWQRGTSGFDTNDTFTADRWRMIESGGTGVVSRQTFTVGSELAGSEYYLNYNVSTASDYTGLKYRIENIKTIEPGTWTISFWAKHTSAGPNGGLIIRGDQNFGSGGSGGVSLTSPAAITTTTSWVRYSKNVTIPSISGKTVGASSYLQLEIGQGADAGTGAWNLDIANVQFEKGEVATDFEFSSFGDEFIRCQRYYQQIGTTTQDGDFCIGASHLTSNGDQTRVGYFGQNNLRATPTITEFGSGLKVIGAASKSYTDVTAITDINVTFPSAYLQFNAECADIGDNYEIVVVTNLPNSGIKIEAEL